jgi:hypothetical protein
MRRPSMVATTLVVGIACLGGLAYFAGPPEARLVPLAAPAIPEPIKPDVALLQDDIGTLGFGAPPRCEGESAVQAVVGLLRRHTSVRVSGLTNVQIVGDASPTEQMCQAMVEIGAGKAVTQYRLSKRANRANDWQVTVLAAPTLVSADAR